MIRLGFVAVVYHECIILRESWIPSEKQALPPGPRSTDAFRSSLFGLEEFWGVGCTGFSVLGLEDFGGFMFQRSLGYRAIQGP